MCSICARRSVLTDSPVVDVVLGGGGGTYSSPWRPAERTDYAHTGGNNEAHGSHKKGEGTRRACKQRETEGTS